MEIKQKIALGIFILSVIVLVILIPFAFFQNKITGKVVETVEKGIEKTAGEVTCTDSDNGKNYNIKGIVDYCDSSGCSSEKDSCSDKKLTEWFCENNERHYEEHNCEFDCDDGVCVNLVTKYKYTGGGGGGGGGAAVVTTTPTTATEIGQTHDLSELTSEHYLELIKGDNIKFSINSQAYTLTLTDNTETQLTISASNGQTFTLIVGSDRNIDLNNDNISEIYIKIQSINMLTGKIKLIFRAA